MRLSSRRLLATEPSAHPPGPPLAEWTSRAQARLHWAGFLPASWAHTFSSVAAPSGHTSGAHLLWFFFSSEATHPSGMGGRVRSSSWCIPQARWPSPAARPRGRLGRLRALEAGGSRGGPFLQGSGHLERPLDRAGARGAEGGRLAHKGCSELLLGSQTLPHFLMLLLRVSSGV